MSERTDFYEDLIRIGQMGRRHVSEEVFDKWEHKFSSLAENMTEGNE